MAVNLQYSSFSHNRREDIFVSVHLDSRKPSKFLMGRPMCLEHPILVQKSSCACFAFGFSFKFRCLLTWPKKLKTKNFAKIICFCNASMSFILLNLSPRQLCQNKKFNSISYIFRTVPAVPSHTCRSPWLVSCSCGAHFQVGCQK